MTAIIFYARDNPDTQAPGLSVYLEAGRASNGSGEFFCLGNRAKRVLLDRAQAADFMNALGKMNRCVRKGNLVDRVFYCFDVYGIDRGCLGVAFGIQVGSAYLETEDRRVNISADDLACLNAACAQARHLAEGGRIGIAHRIAGNQPGPRPIWAVKMSAK